MKTLLKVCIVTFLILGFQIISYSQCTPYVGVEAFKNGDFEKGDDGSCTFGPQISWDFNSQWSTAGHYYIGSNPYLFNTNFIEGVVDHTKGNGLGKMLMVDASIIANPVILQQAVTVIPGQTYYFSAWVSSLSSAQRCSLQFQVGLVKSPGDTIWQSLGNPGMAPAVGVWQQYFGTWNSNLNTNAIVRLADISPADWSAHGNDYAIDDISFINSCANVNSGAKPNLPATISVCNYGGKVDLDTKIKDDPNIKYTWSYNGTQIDTNTVKPNVLSNMTGLGTYTVCVDSFHCIQQGTVNVIANLTVNLGADASYCEPFKANLNSGIINTNGLSVSWYKDNLLIADSTRGALAVSSSGLYKLVVTNAAGNCNATDDIKISSVTTPFTASTTSTNTICGASNSGTASVIVNGGLYAPYTYNWNTGANASTLTGLASGNYQVTITDSKNCTSTASAIVGNSDGGTLNTLANDIIPCNNPNSGILSLISTSVPLQTPVSFIEPIKATCPSHKYYINDNSLIGDLYCTAIGSAANSGTSSSPYDSWATMISHNTLMPADTVFIETGNYTWTTTIAPNNSGSSSCYIVIQGAGATKTIITISAGNQGICSNNGADLNYVKVSDLSLTRPNNLAVEILPSSSNWIFENCNFTTTNSRSMIIRGTNTILNNCSINSNNAILIEQTSLNTSVNNINYIGVMSGNPCFDIHGGGVTITNCKLQGAGSGINVSGNSYSNITISNNNINLSTGSNGFGIQLSVTSLSNAIIERNVIIGSNNLNMMGISIQGGITNLALTNNYISLVGSGILCNTTSTTNVTCYHNSFYTLGNCIGNNFNSWQIKNNIFYSTGNNAYRCVFIQSVANQPASLDYNVYYNPNGAVCGYSGTTLYNTFANWKGIFGNDANSKTGNPNYTCTASGILSVPIASIAENNGIAIGGISTDIMGNTRNTPPEIGAFEIVAPPTYKWSTGATTNTIQNLGVGIYTVTVNNPNGCNSVLTGTITNPASFTLTATPTKADCSTGLGSIALAINPSTGPYTFAWSNLTSNQNLTNVIPGSYQVTVSDGGGCSNNTSATILPSASVNGGISTFKPSICVGDTTTLKATGGTGYLWDNGLSSTASHIINPTTTTTYNVTISDAGCTTVKNITLNVNPLPDIEAGTNQSICLGASATLTATSLTASVFTWNKGIGTINPKTITPLATDIYTVSVSNGTCTAKDSVKIIVIPPPAVDAGKDQIICIGNPVTIKAIAATATGFSWDNGLGAIAQSTFTPQTTGTTTYTVTVTDANNCTNSDAVTISVVSGLVANVSPIKPLVCAGDSTILNATGGTIFNWSNGSVNGNSIKVIPTYPFSTYSVTVSDGNCTSVLTTKVDVYPEMKINQTLIPDTCNKGIGSIALNVTGGSSPYIYNWNDGKTTSSLSKLKTNTYNVTITDIYGCSVSEKIKETNLGGIDAGFIVSPKIASISNPDISFYDNSKGDAAVSYNWNFGDSTISNQKNPGHYYLLPGTYPVTLFVIDKYGCKDTFKDSVIINNISTLYVPNAFTPNSDGRNEIWIPKGNLIDESAYDLRVYDRWGEEIFHTKDFYEGWNGRVNNTSDNFCPEGIYVYIINYQNLNNQKFQKSGNINLIH